MTRATVVLALVAAILAVLAATVDGSSWVEKTLWVAALVAGSLALTFAYGIAITWTRRRKRLWG